MAANLILGTSFSEQRYLLYRIQLHLWKNQARHRSPHVEVISWSLKGHRADVRKYLAIQVGRTQNIKGASSCSFTAFLPPCSARPLPFPAAGCCPYHYTTEREREREREGEKAKEDEGKQRGGRWMAPKEGKASISNSGYPSFKVTVCVAFDERRSIRFVCLAPRPSADRLDSACRTGRNRMGYSMNETASMPWAAATSELGLRSIQHQWRFRATNIFFFTQKKSFL